MALQLNGFKAQRGRTYRRERAAMLRTGAMGTQGLKMSSGAVTLVPVKPVLGILSMKLSAPSVAMNLGQYRCRRDRRHQCIALDHGLSQDIEDRQTIAIDQYLGRPQAQPIDRTLHGQHRGLQDIEAVDFLDAGLRNRTTQRLGADFIEQALPASGGELLGVRQASDGIHLVENDRCSHHGPGQRPTACLIDTRQKAGNIPAQSRLLTGPASFRSHRSPVGRYPAAAANEVQ